MGLSEFGKLIILAGEKVTMSDMFFKNHDFKKFKSLINNIKLNTKDYNLGLNNGSQAGQIVNHVHWHIIPRYKDDGLKHWTSNKEERESLAETLKILKGKI